MADHDIDIQMLVTLLRNSWQHVQATHAMSGSLMLFAADRLDALQSKITRIGGVLVDVLEWAEAQDEDMVPDWVEKLSAAVTEQAK